MSKKTKNVITISGFIDTTTKVYGNIFSENNLKIDGSVNGNVTSLCDVVVSETGVVSGDIVAKSVVIDGCVKGNISTSDTVTLSSSGTIEGNVQTIGFIADIGSTFKGMCKVLNEEKTAPVPAEAVPETPMTRTEALRILKADEPNVYKIKIEKKAETEIINDERSQEDITSELLAEIAAGIES